MASDFPSLVSLACHDLRTPLATVQGFAKTMLRLDEIEPEKQARYLGLIDGASDELVLLLDQLSLAARIESGRYEPRLTQIFIDDVLRWGAPATGADLSEPPRTARTNLRSGTF